jgi:hypothetical protein|tara:strand:- start:403 stop:579 length:177 start_codon:yes stop_codon:yes gene_type:complete
MTFFCYSNKLTHDENFSMWRVMNESERLHNNCRLLNEVEAKQLFDRYYPKNDKKKNGN